MTLHAQRSFVVIAPALLMLLLPSCSGGHPLAGTWKQPHGSTTLPAPLGGGTLDIDATFVMNESAATPTFDMHLGLGAMGLTDVIDAHGTYVATATDLTLDFSGFTIESGSGNTSMVAADGSQCIVLHGFLDTPVCFPPGQQHAYTRAGDVLTLTLDQAIAGPDVSQTTLALTRQP